MPGELRIAAIPTIPGVYVIRNSRCLSAKFEDGLYLHAEPAR